ncbi:hypothetical protein [Streptomyces iconiensis]|uniref:Uncharacterized protein n=1 Tax=Streptomyces iconiensis TaxID=1384038 RepID=A0ABT7A354_9ACTN|nr:hypothetical protein [Streptomyces iconiensis]MDJ1135757.1 hypothetical protein [Streptomyces iconiensis]
MVALLNHPQDDVFEDVIPHELIQRLEALRDEPVSSQGVEAAVEALRAARSGAPVKPGAPRDGPGCRPPAGRAPFRTGLALALTGAALGGVAAAAGTGVLPAYSPAEGPATCRVHEQKEDCAPPPAPPADDSSLVKDSTDLMQGVGALFAGVGTLLGGAAAVYVARRERRPASGPPSSSPPPAPGQE